MCTHSTCIHVLEKQCLNPLELDQKCSHITTLLFSLGLLNEAAHCYLFLFLKYVEKRVSGERHHFFNLQSVRRLVVLGQEIAKMDWSLIAAVAVLMDCVKSDCWAILSLEIFHLVFRSSVLILEFP